MKTLAFSGILTERGWITPAFVQLDDAGTLVEIGSTPPSKGVVNQCSGLVLPGFQNAHSHAFQYAMAGLAEIHPPSKRADNFWSWRSKMYELALTLDPDDMESIAMMVYSEMVRHGYTQVAEFHYVHHDRNGSPYDNPAEMGARLLRAAQRAGIKITLIPMFYRSGGFDQVAEDHQRRFISPTLDDYWKLLEATKKEVAQYSHANIGFGAHSLRAVHGKDLSLLFAGHESEWPFHIHIAEQKKEIDACVTHFNQRPVEYLFDHCDIGSHCHLVHATHLSDHELKMIASSGAHVVLCPTTEGNLGDGLFRFRDFKSQHGQWSIGTDSHVGINPLEELRLLDYGQRLITHQRDTFVAENGDSGSYAFQQALFGGRMAMGNPSKSYFAPGQPFDAVVFDSDQPLLNSSSINNLLSTIIYSGDSSMVKASFVDGREIVPDPSIGRNFAHTIKKLGIRS